MSQLLKLFIGIGLLKASPSSLPNSRFLLNVMAAAYFLVGLLLSLPQATLLQALLQTVVDMVVLVAFVYFALNSTDHRSRLVQTLSATFGVSIIFGVAAGILMAAMFGLASGTPAFNLPAILYILLLIWSLVVFGYILQQSMDVSLFFGVALAMLYTFVSYTLISGIRDYVV